MLSNSVYYILKTKSTCAWAGSPNYLACFVVCLEMYSTKKSSTLYMASIPIHFTRIMFVPCFLLIWVHVLIAMHAMKCSIKTCLLNGCKSLRIYDNMSASISKYAHCKYFSFSKNVNFMSCSRLYRDDHLCFRQWHFECACTLINLTKQMCIHL